MVHVTFVAHDGNERKIAATTGLSLMEAAKAEDVPGIEAVCGGNAYCGTCRVAVPDEWLGRLGPAEGFERELIDAVGHLDEGNGAQGTRLACQIVLDNSLDGLTVRVPRDQT